ncbi:MAG TPA: DEAD/DEAH box helicase [Planctomycetaceae bacterium]|nr:DEAD/DEAH box helicase [Planctomycetaceae bacterium]
MATEAPSRDELAAKYLDQLPYTPYPVQEEALLTWFTSDEGLMVCAPTGTGKTVIAEAALFEALHTGRTAYYTTPLIALTEQKFREMQASAVRWGFSADDVGLVTGNRTVNPQARILVVVAEILLNRLLHPTAFDFSIVSTVVMDEFHSFADPERGVVWELSLAMLPPHVRVLLLSATVGNAVEFIVWLNRSLDRKVQLVQSTERKVPLTYVWVPDELLNEQLEMMAAGEEADRRIPALVFCFNRDECWSVAEQLKGKSLLSDGQQKKLVDELAKHDWSKGAGPKLKQVLQRGVGIHHAGILPKYRRIVEELFQRKLLSVCVCTETLAAGINLPARSVVLTTLVKGPPGKKDLIDPSSAHQMFGRAGRPQFDTQGFVYALAHEDDVKILRFKERINQIPENTKDPLLIRARKKLEKQMPTRSKTEKYWEAVHFEKMKTAPPGKLYSKGQLPWRLLAYLLEISPDVEKLRAVVRKRLMDAPRIEAGQKQLQRMLMSLWAGGFIRLEPEPPPPEEPGAAGGASSQAGGNASAKSSGPPVMGSFGSLLTAAREGDRSSTGDKGTPLSGPRIIRVVGEAEPVREIYQPRFAHPTPELARLLVFRSINPLYGAFLLKHLGIADRDERVQALESVLEVPTSILRDVRVPQMRDLPPGPLARERLDTMLIERGLVTAEQLRDKSEDEGLNWEERWTPTLADKLRLLFDSEFPGVHDLVTRPVWIAGEALRFGGDFNKLITSKGIVRQEGIIFRHLLRLILLCNEFAQATPADVDPEVWRKDLRELADALTNCCRSIDPESTDKAIEAALHAPDLVRGEEPAAAKTLPAVDDKDADEFGIGLSE